MKKQNWNFLGQITNGDNFNPNTKGTHQALPVVNKIDEEGNVVVIFSVRNAKNISLPFKLELNLNEPFSNIKSDFPCLLDLGKEGFFDSEGIMPCELINYKDKDYLFYIGWNQGKKIPFRNALGLAVSPSGKFNFKKISSGPILDRSINNPCFVASCCVVRNDRTKKFLMYYLSCSEWKQCPDGGWRHKYNIKIAKSENLVNWTELGITAIDFKYNNEYAISVPRVLYENGKFSMWYSYRGGPFSDKYQIGYAESTDGLKWERGDEVINIIGDNSNWAKQMQCYPYILNYNDRKYLFFNGNGYGKTGIGLAILT